MGIRGYDWHSRKPGELCEGALAPGSSLARAAVRQYQMRAVGLRQAVRQVIGQMNPLAVREHALLGGSSGEHDQLGSDPRLLGSGHARLRSFPAWGWRRTG